MPRESQLLDDGWVRKGDGGGLSQMWCVCVRALWRLYHPRRLPSHYDCSCIWVWERRGCIFVSVALLAQWWEPLKFWSRQVSPLNNWDRQIGRLWGKLEQLVKWPNFHPSRIIFSLKNKKKKKIHTKAGIGGNYWGLCVIFFFSSLHRIRATNLKPKEMHISFTLFYYCIQFQFEVFNGDLKPGLVFDERVITTVLASTAVWTSACSAVILSGS